MQYQTKAIVLKSKEFKEGDRLVTLFSEKNGKIQAIARGIKKPNSSLRACIQTFSYAQFSLVKGRGLDIITQAKSINFYANNREDFDKTLYCMYLMELLDKSLMEAVIQDDLFTEIIQVLEVLEQIQFKQLYIRYFEIKLLLSMGVMPQLNKCVICGQDKSQSLYNISASEGGVICPVCVIESKNGQIIVSPESLALLKLLANSKIDVLHRVKSSLMADEQMERFLEKYLEYYLERKLKMKNTIRLLKKSYKM